MRLVLTFAATAALAFGSAAHAGTVVNVDFQNPTDPTYTGAGAAPSAGTYWNDVGLSGASNLRADSGSTVTGIGVTLNNYQGYFTWSGAVALTASRLYGPSSGTASVTISGLAGGQNYDIYAYSSFWQTAYSITGYGSQTVTPTNLTNSWVAGNQYVEFASVAASSSGTITLVDTASGSSQWTVIAGLQIVANDATSIPEPTSVALLGSALVGFRTVRRKRPASR